jgi:tRNA1Val (adenine37-N6)-methyltransferase
MGAFYNDDELHELFNGRLKIYQKKKGYRFSIDTILLSHFITKRASGKIADLGTGSGIIPVIIAKGEGVKKIIGIEIQKDLAKLARKNISFNKCEDKVVIIQADIRDLKKEFSPGVFDTVVSNPPFYAPHSGRINPQSQKAIARHELYGSLRDFITIASYLLKPLGKFFAIYSCRRIVDLMEEMRKQAIEAKTLQLIHAKIDESATMVLVEGVKEGGKESKILPPLVLYDPAGNYTNQITAILKEI